jgi:hypothetical protein
MSIEWDSASFEVNQISPSKNTTNWTSTQGKMSTKKKWRDIFVEEMRRLELPTPIPRMAGTPLIAMVTLRFSVQARGPEVINYEPCIKECLADALRRSDEPKVQGWINDDKDEQIRLSVHIMKGRGATKEERGMRVELRWMPPFEYEKEPEIHEQREEKLVEPFYENGDKAVAQLPS